MPIYTIGHSSHTEDKFLEMLEVAQIEVLADVRAHPGSHKYPQFSKDHFPDWLHQAGIAYQHFPNLGGRRSRSADISPVLNGAWNNQSFHNYADYSLSEAFQEGIRELTNLATRKRTVYCCSERHPARCHRLIISNWLALNGWEVKHIINGAGDSIELIDHNPGQWGATPIVEDDGTVVYPETL
ncbi:DUF488 family protein [Virgibacillus kekensis]|uniref:DUF488 family protein n=1 Tax=Virgibacillus kekensis TaxID=202261 RepID=A0ABV9DKF9_9BACI